MRYITIFLSSIFLMTILGCGPSPETESMGYVDEQMVESKEDQKDSETAERKLIKEGQIEFETDDLSASRKTIFEAVKKHKGYIASDKEYKEPERKSSTIIIRVPANSFDSLLSDATKGIERFDSKNINVKDVTEEFLDIKARLKTKKELEQRYITLLQQAKTVTEILEIEKQIGQLRSDIESIEGRLKYLQNQVSLSTLTITFYESTPSHSEFGQKLKIGFKNGWDNLIQFFIILINIWPFILIGFGLIFGIKTYSSKRKK